MANIWTTAASNESYLTDTADSITQVNLPTVPSISDQASEYMIHKIGWAIQNYYLPVVVVIGFFGNILSFIVMSLPQNRKISCCVYMRVLAVSDQVMLYVAAHFWFATTFNKILTKELCQVLVYLFHFCSLNGTLLVVLMAVDRYVLVKKPLEASDICTPRRSWMFAAVTCVVLSIYNIPYAVFSSVRGRNQCAAMSVKSTVATIFSWASLCLNSVVPFTILLTINILIILEMKRHSKMLARHGTVTDGSSAKASQKQNTRDQQITIMLLVVTFSLLLLTIPQYLRYVIYKVVDASSSPGAHASFILVYHITNKLIFTNSAVNFFLYSLAGSKFRSEALRLLMCARRPWSNLFGVRAQSVHPTVSSQVS